MQIDSRRIMSGESVEEVVEEVVGNWTNILDICRTGEVYVFSIALLSFSTHCQVPLYFIIVLTHAQLLTDFLLVSLIGQGVQT